MIMVNIRLMILININSTMRKIIPEYYLLSELTLINYECISHDDDVKTTFT